MVSGTTAKRDWRVGAGGDGGENLTCASPARKAAVRSMRAVMNRNDPFFRNVSVSDLNQGSA